MEKKTPDECSQDDVIDLYDLWLIVEKRKITTLLIVAVFLGIAVAYTILTPKVYRVSNTLVFNQPIELISQDDIIGIVAVIDELLELDKKRAADLFGMPVDALDNIRSIRSSSIKGSSVLRIDIDTLDRGAGIELMEALPRYIQSSPSISNKVAMQKIIMEKNMKDLKDIISSPTRAFKLLSNTVVYVPSIDLYILREKFNNLVIMMEKVEEGQLVTLASKGEVLVKRYKPKRTVILFVGLFVGCFFGILAAFTMEWWNNARRVRGLE